MVSKVSKESGQDGGKSTPTVYCINMDKWYKPYPLYREGQGSNSGKQRIPFPENENKLFPHGGPEIWSIQETGTGVKLRW